MFAVKDWRILYKAKLKLIKTQQPPPAILIWCDRLNQPWNWKRAPNTICRDIFLASAINHSTGIFVWNWSVTISNESALWVLMVCCFSTRASVATVLVASPCVSSYLWVKYMIYHNIHTWFSVVRFSVVLLQWYQQLQVIHVIDLPISLRVIKFPCTKSQIQQSCV